MSIPTINTDTIATINTDTIATINTDTITTSMIKLLTNSTPVLSMLDYREECERKKKEILQSRDTMMITNQQKLKNSTSTFINTTIILKNLPYQGVEFEDLRSIFTPCGSIKFIKILTNDNDRICKGIAFVRFENREGSDNGVAMDGFWYKERKIYVEYAHDKRETTLFRNNRN